MNSRGRLFGFGREASVYGVAVLLVSSLVWQPAVARDRGGRSDGIGAGLGVNVGGDNGISAGLGANIGGGGGVAGGLGARIGGKGGADVRGGGHVGGARGGSG